jgi:hypothetical protein
MAKEDLADRSNWTVQPWRSEFPHLPQACAALGIYPTAGEVHVYVNPVAVEPCGLNHLPEDVQRLVALYLDEGPDARWDPVSWNGGGHVTALSAGSTGPYGPGEGPITPAELEAALRG